MTNNRFKDVLTEVFAHLESHAHRSGLFRRVNSHEPKNAPGNGLSCSIFLDYIGPVPNHSGLIATTGMISVMVRVMNPMIQEPQDDIDPRTGAATAQLMGAYTGDFELGGDDRWIDLLGKSGRRMEAQGGYIEIDKKLYRVMTITVPILVDDLWPQSP